MKAFTFYLLLAYVCLAVQAFFFKGAKPDFILVLTCLYALKYGKTGGLAFGALSGLLIDTTSGFVLGPNIISKALAAFVVGSVREQFFQWNNFINTVVVGFCSIMNILLIYVILETFSTVSFANRSLELSVKEVVYTIIAALILYPLLKPVDDQELPR